MDQLYRICHISKRKAKWLLENGVIPCEDSGKWTRRFQIHLEDVITFLERRDAGLLQKAIPAGIFSSGGRTLEQPRQILDSGALADRLASYEGQTISARSELHEELLEEFQREQNSGMEWGSMSL